MYQLITFIEVKNVLILFSCLLLLQCTCLVMFSIYILNNVELCVMYIYTLNWALFSPPPTDSHGGLFLLMHKYFYFMKFSTNYLPMCPFFSPFTSAHFPISFAIIYSSLFLQIFVESLYLHCFVHLGLKTWLQTIRSF